ncbi:MAG: hypothetical protein HC841_01715 [Verrucomicrobiae bacterium]|nr:hypothetical protein [Verrucomicrobiae bacterium]
MKLLLKLPTLALLLASGCSTNQKVGGQYIPVELSVVPPASRAFLVPSTRWREGLLDNPSEARKYEVDADGPIKKRIPDMPYKFVAEWEDGRRREIEVDPIPNSPNAFVLTPK